MAAASVLLLRFRLVRCAGGPLVLLVVPVWPRWSPLAIESEDLVAMAGLLLLDPAMFLLSAAVADEVSCVAAVIKFRQISPLASVSGMVYPACCFRAWPSSACQMWHQQCHAMALSGHQT